MNVMLQPKINEYFKEIHSVFKDYRELPRIFNGRKKVELSIDEFWDIFLPLNEYDMAGYEFVILEYSLNHREETMQLLLNLISRKGGQTILIPLNPKEKNMLWDMYVDLKAS